MTMQYDVHSAHLNTSGFAYIGRTRVKGLMVATTAAGGTISIWDTTTAPVAATYQQAGTAVLITKASHGLTTGTRVGVSYQTDGSGVSATNGNYVITVVDANSFAVTEINSRTIAALTNCAYVANPAGNSSTQWHFTMDTGPAAGTVPVVIPGEGLLIETALYLSMTTTAIPAVSVFYG